MHALQSLLAERLAGGLRRKSIKACSKWAEEYRVMGQPFPGQWSFKHHPWVKEIHDCDSELLVGQKAAQMAYTETALNITFFHIDIQGDSVLYVLPASKPDASDFSTSRFDPALEESPHLRTLFTNVKNIHHKRAGFANLFIRGSRSRSQMKSVPVALIILDEVDEMVQENIPLVFERISGQLHKKIFMLSTPTIENYGINAHYQSTTQEEYFFKCPSCSKQTRLIYPDCLVITSDDITSMDIEGSHLICKECKNILPHETKTEWLSTKNAGWVKAYTDRIARGFNISQLYSMTVRPSAIAKSVIKARLDPSEEQELFNSKLGLPHAVDGAKLTDSDINDCIGDYTMRDRAPTNAFITMGIDVGKWLHYEIDQWFLTTDNPGVDINLLAECRVIKEGRVAHFEELDNLFRLFQVRCAVIDANPERRKALEFAQRFYGAVKLCFYGKDVKGKTLKIGTEESLSVTVDRTSWLDLSLGRFRNKTIKIPQNTGLEYKAHLKAPVRVYKKDADGNPMGFYVSGTKEDHHAHARNYAEIALPIAAGLYHNEDVREY